MELDQSVIDKLPAWASFLDGVIQVDPSQAYPEYMGLLEMEPDQYSVEVARRCMTLELLELVGPGILIKIINPKDENGNKLNSAWALANLPPSEVFGELSAATGRLHARKHFDTVKIKRSQISAV